MSSKQRLVEESEIDAWYAQYTAEFCYEPSLVFNWDETMVALAERKLQVVTLRSKKPVAERVVGGQCGNHVSLGVFINAAGRHTKPVLIVPQTTVLGLEDDV